MAVKVLPEAFAFDPERLARFEREATVLASLNHPHIATLYGMEQAEGRHYLVMELVEGRTLAELIAESASGARLRAPDEREPEGPRAGLAQRDSLIGPKSEARSLKPDRARGHGLPLEQALSIAPQIAEALEAAHEQGVVHRDLKPANVKITPDDTVKVLDFGLAKAMETSPTAASLTQSPTLSMAATQAGIILGTAAYMSPEQAKGFAADQRSDVFSFGVVLYEMLTGRQPFQGDTIPEVLASVLARVTKRVHDVARWNVARVAAAA